jgi:hypothetical protein
MSTLVVTPSGWQENLVIEILESAGPRGASHEDFVEAGIAPGYIAVLRQMVDEDRLDLRVDFTTGAARWAVDAASSGGRRRAA